MSVPSNRCLFLASVTSASEAVLAHTHGADIIDAKDPSRGALGALPVATVAAIRAALPRHVPASATIGDLPADPGQLVAAARAMAESGCDMIKIGFFPGGDARGAIAALGQLEIPNVRLVGLLLADQAPDFSLVPVMARAGFAGVMLDTAGKGSGSLLDHVSMATLDIFIEQAHAANLFAGLAGSLRLSHVASLMRLKPHVLGFRGALCEAGNRTGCLSGDLVAQVRAAFESDKAPVSAGET